MRFGQVCVYKGSGQFACAGKVHTQRICGPAAGITGGVLAEETFMRFLVNIINQPEIQHEMVIFQYFINIHYSLYIQPLNR